MWKLQPPVKKVNPLFPSNQPLKIEVLSSPPNPLLKIWLETQSPPVEKTEGGAHYDTMIVFDSYSRMSKGVQFK